MAKDVLEGLSATPKYLMPKYFYDDNGSQIFQDIMRMPEYYLTDCEMEIFQEQCEDIVKAFGGDDRKIDLIELGSGDGVKTKILLSEILKFYLDCRFIPIDISEHANAVLKERLKKEFPELAVQPKTGDYFHLLESIEKSNNKKIILFFGSNIGNFTNSETRKFLSQLGQITQKGDMVFIGFDLKKDPQIIQKAYDDPYGLTARFNKNLLKRINIELSADFKINHFIHHACYNPVKGDMKSYLISTQAQDVFIQALDKSFHFAQWEAIFMERSRKYDIATIAKFAKESGFAVKQNFIDKRYYFADSLWKKI